MNQFIECTISDFQLFNLIFNHLELPSNFAREMWQKYILKRSQSLILPSRSDVFWHTQKE